MQKCVLVIEAAPRGLLCGAFSAASLEPMEFWGYATGSAEAARSLSSDLAAKGLKPVKTLLSIHSSRLSMRILDIPITERKKLKEVVTLQADELFVKGVEGLSIDAVALKGGKAAVVAIDKEFVAGELKALSDAGIDVLWAGPALLSKGLLLKKLCNNSGTSALIDDDSMTVASSGEPIFFKHLDCADDLLLSVAALEADGVNIDTFYSAGTADLAKKAGIKASEAGKAFEHASLLAVALQQREGLKESVDFLKWHADPKEEAQQRRRIKTAWALLCVVIAVWGAYSYYRYQNIRAELSSIEASMEKGFQAVFPGERPKDPFYALEVRVKELAREREVTGERIDALRAFFELSEAAKGADVRVHEFEASGKRIEMKSEAASYEEASAFRERASKGSYFKKVSITETRPGPNGRVRFILSAELGDA